MTKIEFTKEFYKKVYEALCDYCQENFENLDGEAYGTCNAEVEVDGFVIEAECGCECEFEDSSFDHAFGTWHDPYAGYVFSDVEGISDVTVWDEEGDEVEGFSIEAYDNQFIEDEHNGIMKGDKVVHLDRGRYSDVTGTVMHYNSRTCKFYVEEEIHGHKFHRNYSYYHLKKVA